VVALISRHWQERGTCAHCTQPSVTVTVHTVMVLTVGIHKVQHLCRDLPILLVHSRAPAHAQRLPCIVYAGKTTDFCCCGKYLKDKSGHGTLPGRAAVQMLCRHSMACVLRLMLVELQRAKGRGSPKWLQHHSR
jgi:hypothetical protein